MWEIELRARVGAVRVPLWRTDECEVVDPVLRNLRQRLGRAGTGHSSVRQIAASWLRLLDAVDERMRGSPEGSKK